MAFYPIFPSWEQKLNSLYRFFHPVPNILSSPILIFCFLSSTKVIVHTPFVRNHGDCIMHIDIKNKAIEIKVSIILKASKFNFTVSRPKKTLTETVLSLCALWQILSLSQNFFWSRDHNVEFTSLYKNEVDNLLKVGILVDSLIQAVCCACAYLSLRAVCRDWEVQEMVF